MDAIKTWWASKGPLQFVALAFMLVATGFSFVLGVNRWGWLSPDPITHWGSVLVAGGVELGVLIFILLFNAALYRILTPEWQWGEVIGWGLATAGCVALSIYVSVTYYKVIWTDAYGNVAWDAVIRSLVPMALVVGFGLVRPKQVRYATAAEVKQKYAGKIAEAEAKAEIAEIEQRSRDKRRKERDERDAHRAEMLSIAHQHGIDAEARFYHHDGDELIWDLRGFQHALEEAGLWPPVRSGLATLPSLEAFTRGAVAGAVESAEEDAALDESAAMSTSGKQRTMFTAAEIVQQWAKDGISVTVQTVEKWMDPQRNGNLKYALKNRRKFQRKKGGRGRGYEWRAPLEEIARVRALILADRPANLIAFAAHLPTQPAAQPLTLTGTDAVAPTGAVPAPTRTARTAYEDLEAE